MIFLNITDLPWKGREVHDFPSIVTNTVADAAIETYEYDGEKISIEVKDKDDVGRVVAAINMAVGSDSFGIVSEDGNIIEVRRRATNIIPALIPVTPTPRLIDLPVFNPNRLVAASEPVEVGPSVRERDDGDINPRLRNPDEVMNRQAIADADIEKHLYSSKNSNNLQNINALTKKIKDYEDLMKAMISIRREISELSELSTNDSTVKSVINQIRIIASGMPNNKIEDVFVTKTYIVFKTTPIHALNSKTNQHHNIGRIFINIPIQSIVGNEMNPLIFQPIDLVYKSEQNVLYFLPHIDGSGGACYGNATEVFIEAIVNRDIVCLIDAAIRFLENPNMDDVLGRSIINWPVVEA